MSSRLHGLDALRGIAALAVALHHLARLYGAAPPPLLPSLAVDHFFILSGFVMARTYEGRMRQGMTAPQFLTLRYRRLFGPLFIGSTLGLFWAVLRYGPALDLVLAYVMILGFLPAFWLPNCFLINGPAWSLFIEIIANTFHGVVFGKLSDSLLFGVWVIATIVFCVTFLMGVSHWAPEIGAILSLIPRGLSCYVMGILLFRRWGDEPLGHHPGIAIAIFPILLNVALFNPWVELATVLIAAPLVLRASLSLSDAPWAAWLGALSYPLYATHMPVIRLATLAGLPPSTALFLALAAALGVTVAVEMRRKSAHRQVNSTDESQWRFGIKVQTTAVYVAVSGFCLVLHNLVLITADSFGLPLWSAILLSFVLVTTTAYVLHGLFTFRQTLALLRYARFAVAMSANIPLAFVTTWLWHVPIGLPMAFAAPIASACMLALNFALSRWAITAPVYRAADTQ
jgi:peptidoglycan/LPS O-acetylase OafA/YrhL/putative flippase GtrA